MKDKGLWLESQLLSCRLELQSHHTVKLFNCFEIDKPHVFSLPNEVIMIRKSDLFVYTETCS